MRILIVYFGLVAGYIFYVTGSSEETLETELKNFATRLQKYGANRSGASSAQKFCGVGKYKVLYVEKCDDWEQYDIDVEVEKRKLNRTHDIFNARLKLPSVVDDTYIRRGPTFLLSNQQCQVDFCKFVDGGCKPWGVLADDNIERFVKKFGESNVQRALAMAGLDPPDFPIPAGEYKVDKYMVNYDELPILGPYGEYLSVSYLIKDSVKKACVKTKMKFSEIEEDDKE